MGVPFIGESGYFFEQLVSEAMSDDVRRAYTNVVGCIPRNKAAGGSAVTAPSAEAIQACEPRLAEFIAMCEPKLIMAVGHVAQNALEEMKSRGMLLASLPVVYVVHPSFIMRTPCNGSLARGAIETIRRTVVEHVLGETGSK